MNFRFLLLGACFCLAALAQPTAPTPPAAPRSSKVAALSRGPQSYLGVDVVEVDADRAKARNLKEERGVEVTHVGEDSPAARSGLHEGDVILEYNGQRVEGLNQFVRMVGETPIGRKAALGIVRNGVSQTLYATIGQRPAQQYAYSFDMPMAIAPMAPMPPMAVMPDLSMPDIPSGMLSWQSPSLGMLSEPVDGQLAEFFGVKEGVLVRSVTKNSPAEKGGLKAGDVILKVEGNTVRNPREVTAVVRRQRDKKSISVTVMRNRREVTLEITPNTERSSGRTAFGDIL